MDVMEAILGRRSIRKFTAEPVTEEQIRVLLSAAMAAPSAGNAQTWRFVVITERDILDRIGEINPYAVMASHAPLAVLVCADVKAERFPGYWVQDCSAAVQNLLLAAHAQGLGAVWTGIHPVPERIEGFSGLVHLPENITPLGLVVVGHPMQTLPPHQNYDASKVHYNQW